METTYRSLLASSDTADDASAFDVENVASYVYLAVRVLLGLGVVWIAGGFAPSTRFHSGVLMATFTGFCTFAFLEMLFDDLNMEPAFVLLYILVANGILVGLCLGLLLPSLVKGICWGGMLGLYLSAAITFIPSAMLMLTEQSAFLCYATIGSLLAAIGAALAVGYGSSLLFSVATVLAGGATAASLIYADFLSYLVGVARGDIHEGFDLECFLMWSAACLLVAGMMVYRDGSFDRFLSFPRDPSGYMFVSDGDVPPNKKSTPPVSHRDPPPPQDAYNMFDPANLPPRLAEYANMVYSACEDIGNFFGFQDSSVRNQAEHLLILLSNNRRYMSSHILPPSVQPPSPIHALHAKVFSNYVKWCRAMGVPPNFSKMNTSMNAPPAVASRVVDLVLFFCIWGEASNIRHMPECLWFLYHKMMEEYIQSEGYTQTRSLYAGFYVDCVITPIFDIVVKNMKSKKDHEEKRNYDDFNEFFWSRACLKYRYTWEDPVDSTDVEARHQYTGMEPKDLSPSVVYGLEHAPKTFLEKRSWLRGMLALNRILEWHIVTFYLLAVIAFSRELVWGWVETFQVASAVFWIYNSLHLCWALLEVWASYPGIHLTGTEVCGSVFVIVARFLLLVHQSLYLLWALSSSSTTYLGNEGSPTFWWWQYIWLSQLVMLPYYIEMLIQLFPPLGAKIYLSQSEYVQAFLNVFYPLSRLYVGKEVQESLSHTSVYVVFWASLMVWKLFFSYVFEVYSMVLPSLQLTDDYLNYPGQSFAKMLLLLGMRWLPQFIVYLIDMSIWYAAWQAFAGTSVGLSDHLGDVRSFEDIRHTFGKAPENFCKKMLSPDAGSRRGSSASFLGASDNELSEKTSLLQADGKLHNYVNRLLDVRIQKWVMFSAAWNEIIDHFRNEDIISNAESDNLKFSQFDGFSQAIYLPVFQTAGVIDNVLSELERPSDEYRDPRTGSFSDDNFFEPINIHITMQTAVAEIWELGSYFFLQVFGQVHSDDINAMTLLISKWFEGGQATSKMKLEATRKVFADFVGAIQLLHKGMKKRKAKSKSRAVPPTESGGTGTQTSSKGMRRAVSAGSLSSLEKDVKSPVEATVSKNEIVVDALRDQVRDKLRNFVHSIKNLLKNTDIDAETRDMHDRLTFIASMENGFFWDDAYASDQLDEISRNQNFTAVLKKIHGLVCMHPDDAEPKSKEVKRRLTFFVNSLFMDMPEAPSIHDMFSWNVLTPYYSEDVTYSKGDLEKRTDALGVSTLLYLQTLYKADWANFLERMEIKDEDRVWSSKFVDETRRWASIRAQTLSRTVNGMMYCEKALRLLANLERLDEDTTNDLLKEKFGYIVSCQVYGNMKRNQDPKADDIEDLMHRFPHLRIAYIDTKRLNRSGASVFCSVLVKSDGKGSIKEIYRVRLPGNPVIGEGKPENQNHAMIFTRGEFIQTIDMNQEGYFEEALKMRNCLQEFAKREGPLPTTILGLREHIFTGSVSSLANYMALQEISFVTLGQRVLTRPLHIRLHYGHPDVFDKLFFITRGGISKASKGINLSEDIFAGYSNVIRGGTVGFKEYVQVGKGRDVGMSQIYKFEAKLSQGAAEQSLSRDVYRMCHRLDFFRLLSFYYGGIGHYFSNVLTILTVYIVVYLMAVLAVFNLEKIGNRLITPMGMIQMMLGGLGLLQTIPLFATLGVERGWLASAQEIFLVFITGGPLHFMFHIQTKATYMAQTILVGGAKYRPTGRGFVTQHTPFDEQFRFFASSHLYLGVELAAGLVLMAVYTDAGQYFGRTWSLWLASCSFLCSPFWFNPLTFEWRVVLEDYKIWLKWILGVSGGATKSWSMWWNEENAFYKGMPVPSKVLYILKAILYTLLAEGIRTSNLFRSDMSLRQPMFSITHVIGLALILVVLGRLFSANERAIPYPVRRTIGIVLFVGLGACALTLIIEDTNFIRYALAAYYFLGAICLIGLLSGFNKLVKNFYLVHDLVCAHIIFIPLFILAALQLPGMIQTWLLYHNALSTDVVVSDILRYARKSQESGGVVPDNNDDMTEQITELRKMVQRQQQMLVRAGLLSDSDAQSLAGSTLALETSSPAASKDASIRVEPARPSYGRAVSMSGLDVWSNMALGDVQADEMRQAPMAATQGHETAPGAPQGGSNFSFSQPEAMPPRYG
eukprot:CAMPEP_0172442256 /NCGR_PEP_ID=MMETSP1065-20121228/2711_1 /TAXON_ID=265537 /ORGANISM="Amphiprora paludosa, Strain CCMP125" /LENGTH=2141 /DNA_ID=CAMNT_0013192053 /DNA_START=185 /DNA_END=6610 /DNA_ORIENTATION=+